MSRQAACMPGSRRGGELSFVFFITVMALSCSILAIAPLLVQHTLPVANNAHGTLSAVCTARLST